MRERITAALAAAETATAERSKAERSGAERSGTDGAPDQGGDAKGATGGPADLNGAALALRLATLRLLMAAIKDRDAVAVGAESDGGDASTRAGDPEILSLLGTMVQQRRDSADTYEQDGRIDLAERERAEGAIIEEFLPPPMSRDDISAAVSAVIAEIGASGVRDIGRVMAALKARYSGRMDFSAAGGLVREALS